MKKFLTIIALWAACCGFTSDRVGVGSSGYSTPTQNNLIVQGKVGIGTTSPGTELDVYGYGKVRGLNRTFASNGGNLMLLSSDPYWSAEDGGLLSFGWNYGGNTFATAGIKGFKDTVTWGDNNGDMAFATYNTTNGMTENMRITGANGNVGIGTSIPTAKLEVDGGILSKGNLTITSGSTFTVASGSTVNINGYKMPSTDGTAGQAMQTDGAGNLGWGFFGGLTGIAELTSGSSGTWYSPTGVRKVLVIVIGGGGAGAVMDTNYSSYPGTPGVAGTASGGDINIQGAVGGWGMNCARYAYCGGSGGGGITVFGKGGSATTQYGNGGGALGFSFLDASGNGGDGSTWSSSLGQWMGPYGGGGSAGVCISILSVTSSGVAYSVGTGGQANNGNPSIAAGGTSYFGACTSTGGGYGQSYNQQWGTSGGNGKIVLMY